MPKRGRVVELDAPPVSGKYCDGCGSTTYYRCDEIKGWPTRNPGKRAGWGKRRARLCHKCSPMSQSQRMFTLFTVTAAPARVRRLRRVS